MPMLHAGRYPDRITGPDFLNGTVPMLHATDASSNDQRLAEGMRVPGGSCSRLEVTVPPPIRASPLPVKRESTRTEPVKFWMARRSKAASPRG